MKALTLHQPWASLIALGAKTIETRSWPTSYRGPLAIHAAKRNPTPGEVGEWRVGTFPRTADRFIIHGDGPIRGLPLGGVIATCELVDVLPMVESESLAQVYERAPTADRRDRRIGEPSAVLHEVNREPRLQLKVGNSMRLSVTDASDQLPYGDFRPGRFAWLLENVVALPEPIPATGRQQLWELSA